MPLTPSDVANKQFKVAFRGYALAEVDAFLDEVEAELTRLLTERAHSGGETPPPPPPTSRPSRAISTPDDEMEGPQAALRTLMLAQRTADEAVAEARAEAEQIVSAARTEAETSLSAAREQAEQARTEGEQALASARSEAEQVAAAARAEAEQAVTAARAEADQIGAAARTEAEATLAAAQREAEQTVAAGTERAAGLDAEIAARLDAALGDLEQRRQSLEQRVSELTAFEREYRTRLRAYFSDQLRALDGNVDQASDGGTGAVRVASSAPPAPGSQG